MQIPTLPTDNLYKFVTVLGFVALIAPILYMAFVLRDVESKIAATEANISVLDLRQKFNSTMIEKFSFAISKDNLTTDDLIKLSSELKIYQNDTFSNLNDIAATQYVQGARIRALREDIWYCIAISFVGMLASTFGIYYWYTRHQKYQDDLARYQAVSALRDIETAKASG
ncbi:hypothetical protein [Bosea sp. 117]|uniref:hypothetical protein n=1 Tax=Bosea sp. 117 TaxID=1125973 RepID=UPI0012DBD3DF|nr:hypothetical protein [Bosea sp. 117]